MVFLRRRPREDAIAGQLAVAVRDDGGLRRRLQSGNLRTLGRVYRRGLLTPCPDGRHHQNRLAETMVMQVRREWWSPPECTARPIQVRVAGVMLADRLGAAENERPRSTLPRVLVSVLAYSYNVGDAHVSTCLRREIAAAAGPARCGARRDSGWPGSSRLPRQRPAFRFVHPTSRVGLRAERI